MKKYEANKIYAHSEGVVTKLETVADGVFSEKMLGDGFVITIPKTVNKTTFYAPMTGKLVSVFPTGHAYGIETGHNIDVLLHIGIDTVKLDGKGFKVLVKQGQKVKVGDPLVEVDLDFIRQNAPFADGILVVTSMQKVDVVFNKTVMPTDEVAVLKV